MVRRALAALLSSSIILLSPGLAAYAAAGQTFASQSAPKSEALPAALPIRVIGPASPSLLPPSTLPSGFALPSLALPASAQAGSARAAAPQAAAIPASAVAPASAVTRASAASAASAKSVALPGAAAAAPLASVSRQIETALAPLGAIERAQPGQAREAGAAVQDLLSGGRSAAVSDSIAAAPAVQMGALGGHDTGLSYAKTAGRDSIGDAAEAYFGGGAPTPPAPPSNGGGNGSDGGNPGPKKAPLAPRLLTSVFALAPAALIGWPLLAAGSLVAGALTILASLGVAVLPFMSEGTPKVLRALPGVAIGALGLTALISGALAGAAPVIAMGAVVTLGGWGFVRFARTGGKKYDTAQELIAAFFGALGAVTGAGLVLLAPGGMLAAGLTIAAYPVTLALYMYLPGWIGEALTAAVHGLYLSVRDAHAVLSSLRRDTSLKRRLDAYTRASLKRSPWNAVWLGLLVWLPLLVSEAASSVVGAAGGLVLGAMRLPLMLLWGASHKLKADSKPTKFLATWASFQFEGSKVLLFNRFETPLLPWANSDRFAKRAAAGLAIRGLQLAWLAYSIAITPLAYAIGFVHALRAVDKPYDANTHDPNYLKLASDPLPAAVPEVPQPEVTTALPSKILAAAIGLSPLWLLGAHLIGTGFLGWGMIAAAVAIGAMPLMPSSAALPAMLRRAPGTLLALVGGFSAFGAARMALFVGLPTGMILPLGVVALLAGIGLRALIDKLRDSKTSEWKLDQPEYIGGFVSALSLSAALGAALLGLTGPLALGLTIAGFALSPLLLYHLPRYLWAGVGAAVTSLPAGVAAAWDFMSLWRHDSKFNHNLNAWYGYWTKQSIWYAAMFLVPWALTLAAFAVDAALSLAVGLVIGATRVLPRFAWGLAFDKNPESRAAKFWTGFNTHLVDQLEGAKASQFDPKAAALLEAAGEKDARTSRPTLKALAALTGARLLQVLWLVRLLAGAALTPFLWLLAIPAGLRSDKAQRPRRGLF